MNYRNLLSRTVIRVSNSGVERSVQVKNKWPTLRLALRESTIFVLTFEAVFLFSMINGLKVINLDF